MTRPPSKRLTDVELELMSILWKTGGATVHEVQAALPPGRNLAYTSVSTILRILEQKKILQTRKEGRGHRYVPRVSKADHEAATIEHVVEKVFDGERASLIRRLIDSQGISESELLELKKILTDRLGK
ncbi:MAG: BlaI/MecI/CopY family transcriptional regulator [Bdellovibrionales bacterium]|nr:BlaI/MecI/CopY family transcriptional regulator [Bdellovibrionales bacterium]